MMPSSLAECLTVMGLAAAIFGVVAGSIASDRGHVVKRGTEIVTPYAEVLTWQDTESR